MNMVILNIATFGLPYPSPVGMIVKKLYCSPLSRKIKKIQNQHKMKIVG